MKKIAIIIVNWNGFSDTIVCLSSLAKLSVPKGFTIETIVVDNGSTNDSARHISAACPWATILTLPTNTGFTGGNNIGIQYAMKRNASYIWLLNNDTIVHKNAARLVEAFSDETVGIAGSKIYFAPGHEYHHDRYTKEQRGKVFWYAGGLVDWDNLYASHKGVDEVDTGQYETTSHTAFVSGCSMMIRRSVVEKIGELDNRFYLYLEDLDYCLRAKKQGYALVYYPHSVVWHVNAGSSGGAGNPIHDYYITRNRLLVGFRYASIRTKVALLREAYRFLRGDNPEKKQAVADFFLQRWGRRYESKKHPA